MPEYFSPGVYVEEVDAGPKPIEGVSTSIAGAVGVTLRGPTTGKPVLVTSFADFTRQFGGFVPEPDEASLVNKWALDAAEGGRWWYFPLSVKGFFENGGQQLYVKRAFSSDAVASSMLLGQGVDAVLSQDAEAGADVLHLEHLFGIDSSTTQLQIFANGKPVKDGAGVVLNFDVASYDPSTNAVTLKTAVPQQLKAGRDYLAVVARKGPAPPAAVPPPDDTRTLTFTAKALGAWGDGIGVRIGPMVGGTMKILADPLLGGAKAQASLTADAKEPVAFLAAASVAGASTTLTAASTEPSTTLTVAGNAGDATVTVAVPAGFAVNDVATIGGVQYTITVVAGPVFTINPVLAATQIIGAPVQRMAQPASVTVLTVTDSTGFAVNDMAQIGPKVFKITAVDGPGKTLTISPPVPDGVTWPVDFAVRGMGKPLQVNDSTGFAANDIVSIDGNKFKVGAVAAGFITLAVPVKAWPLGTEVIRLAESPGNAKLAVDDSSGFAVGDRVQIFKREFALTAVAAQSMTLDAAIPDGAFWPQGTVVQRMRPANDGASDTIYCANAVQLYVGAMIELDNGSTKERRIVEVITGSELTLDSNVTNKYYEGHKLRIIEVDVRIRFMNAGVVEASEHFPNLRLVNDGTVNYIVNFINGQSQLVNAKAEGGYSQTVFTEFPCAPAHPPADSPDVWVDLANGDDSYDTLSIDDFIGVDGGSDARTGIQALEDRDQISLCMVPQIWSQSVHDALIVHCETLRYRFAILDPQDGLSIDRIREARSIIDTKYAALYYPWIEVRDPSIKRNVDIAPSAHMAGIYSRVDTDRGYFKAPANEVISGITKIAQDITKREQDLLNPFGINALRFFPDRGNRVWGARTVSSDSSWKYINVRRIFIFVEASIDKGTQWVVFEPNDEPLWARVRQTIGNFLNTVWRSGALQGAKPDEAYFVKCDHTTMTQDDIDNGKLICVIGIAPVKPAEFVIFRIQQKTLDTTTS